jgi:6-phosphogluconate dehydrogenase
VNFLRPVFETLAPAADRGWAHVGPAGAGHFVKMVHNGIEYGMMQAYAEGFAILRTSRASAAPSTASTSRRSPRCGGTAAWCARGCST